MTDKRPVHVNYTWPGRFHLVVNGSVVYITLWLFKRRFHFMRPEV